MFKKLALVIGTLALAAGSLFADAQNAVVLDLNRVIETFSKTVAIKAEVEADQKFAEEGQKSKVDAFNKLRKDLEAAVAKLKADRNNPTVNPAAVKKTEAEVERLYTEAAKAEQELRKTQQELSQLLQKSFAEKTNQVLQEDILPRIKDIAKAHGADIVLNARVGIIFADKSVDITDELLECLAKDFPVVSSSAE